MQQVRANQLADWLNDKDRPSPLLLDVREPWEYELCHLAGSRHLPMHLVPIRLEELPRDEDIVVICHHGIRSLQVALFLEREGFEKIHNLSGGIEAWSCDVDPKVPRY